MWSVVTLEGSMFQTPWRMRRIARLPFIESSIGRTFHKTSPNYLSDSSLQAPPTGARRTHSTSNGSQAPIKIVRTSTSHDQWKARQGVLSREQEFEKFYKQNPYPRWKATDSHDSVEKESILSFRKSFYDVTQDPLSADLAKVRHRVTGRITSVRSSGKKLAFIDIFDNWGHKTLQVYLSLKSMDDTRLDPQEFKNRVLVMRRGDVILVTGHPYKTATGEFSIRATQLPELLAPCLQHFPVTNDAKDQSSQVLNVERYVEMQTNYDAWRILALRAAITRTIRRIFEDMQFIEVETPILAASAGGATARPFVTSATEFPERKLSLRIAPELWLKKLIIGGMKQVFEIGRCFRNEGLDKTHNPEFTTCEFYAQKWDLRRLMQHTHGLFQAIFQPDILDRDSPSPIKSTQPYLNFMKPPYAEIDFIPALNEAMNIELPNLAAPDAQDAVEAIFNRRRLPAPEIITLPRLMDKLCSIYLEPQCTKPTWIVNIPECLSPLAKSFIHPTAPNNQPVAARAELFVRGKELVNCYEEENSPYEQRRKFMDQQRFGGKDDPEAMVIDEEYLKALEWGLPPTGGWGCGIDRLVMLYAGKDKISDVLSFGNLRAVTRGAEKENTTQN